MNAIATPQTASAAWNIDPAHTHAEFKVRHMMVSNVKGHFAKLQGSLILDENNLTNSKVEATIDAASIETREPQRDAHLRSADFLDAARFPTLTFNSTNVIRRGEGELAVEGDLTIHGVTRRVVFNVEGPTPALKDPWGNTRIGVSATTKINRKEFGLTWNAVLESGGIVVGEEVAITLEVEFVKA